MQGAGGVFSIFPLSPFPVALLFWLCFVVVGWLGLVVLGLFLVLFFRTLEASLIQQRPLYIKAKENTSYQIKKVEMSKKSLRDKEKSCDKEKQNIKELEIELNDIEKAWRAFEEKAEEERVQRAADIELGESQVNQGAQKCCLLEKSKNTPVYRGTVISPMTCDS